MTPCVASFLGLRILCITDNADNSSNKNPFVNRGAAEAEEEPTACGQPQSSNIPLRFRASLAIFRYVVDSATRKWDAYYCEFVQLNPSHSTSSIKLL